VYAGTPLLSNASSEIEFTAVTECSLFPKGAGLSWPLTMQISINTLLLLIGPLLQSWLAVILLKRRAYRTLPLFFTYTLFSLVAEITALAVHQNAWKYFYVYWSAEAIYAVLGFMAIYEAFRRVFWHFYLMWWWFKFLAPAVGLFMLTLSIVEGVMFPPTQAPPVLSAIVVAEMAVRCLQGGIFFLFMFLVVINSLPWQNQAFGVAFGFSISGLGIFITFVVRSKFGTHFIPVIQFVPPVAYILAVIIWLFSFSKREPPSPFEGLASPLTPERVLAQLRRLSQEMKGLFKRCLAISS
jgi:hypothetical protein